MRSLTTARLLGCLLTCAGLLSTTQAKENASLWEAEVLAEQPKVFQNASASSRMVAQLRKGDSVTVVLKITVSGQVWCRIELRGQLEPMGYLECDELKLASASKRLNSGTPPKTTSTDSTTTSAQPPVSHPAPGVLTNIDILELSKSGFSPDILVAKIKSSSCNFDTSPAALRSLKAANLGDKVILAMVEAREGQPDAKAPIAETAATGANTSAANTPGPEAVETRPNPSATSPCVILKRMGPADQITSHMYAFGIRGKQFQFVEGELPKGATFHGRLTDHDVRTIQEKGGRFFMLEPKYSVADLEEARKGCARPE
jgi:hypothetical protein